MKSDLSKKCGAERLSHSGVRGEIEARILEAVRSLRFGTVEVTVHASEVVQIERREKVRFEKNSKDSAAAARAGVPPEPPTAG